MPDDPDASGKKSENEETGATSSFPLKPAGEVVVTHLDSPPPSGPRSIHPRRPAPIVPERRSDEGPAQGPKEPASE